MTEARAGAGRTALFLTHDSPLPLVSGYSLRSYHLMRELGRRGWSLSLFSLVTGAGPGPEDERALRELCEDVELVPFRDGGLARARRLLAATATRRAFQRTLFHSRAAARRFGAWRAGRAWDAVVVDQLYMAPYVPDDLAGAAVLDAHNVEAARVASMAGAGGLRGLVARAQLGPVRRFEADVVRRFPRTVAVSESERDALERLAPGRVDLVPNGVDCELHAPRAGLPSAPGLLFLGSLDYGANVDGLAWLVESILPLVRTPGTRLAVVGRRPGADVAGLVGRAPGATLHGDVPDTRPYLEAARLMVVPLRFGGGTRLKILEALAHGVPVVSTTLGAEGLALEHGTHLLLADDAEAFAAAVDRLLADDELCLRLAAAGRERVERLYDWRAAGEALEAALLRLPG